MSDLTDNSAERIWLCIRVNNARKHCEITLKIIVILQNVCENSVRILKEEKQALSAPYVRYLMKKVKKSGILIDKPKREKPKAVHNPKKKKKKKKMLLWQKVCMKRHQHHLTIVLNNRICWRYHFA